jgi:centrosomal protein CEP76
MATSGKKDAKEKDGKDVAPTEAEDAKVPEASPDAEGEASPLAEDAVAGEGEQTDGKKEKPKASAGVLSMLPKLPYGNDYQEEKLKDPMDRSRWWELVLSIRGFENVTTETLKLFWTVSLGSENPKKHRNRVRLQTRFSQIFTLEKGQVYEAPNPIILYDRKTFNLSYKELEKHVVKIDMWRVSCWTFNEYYGVKKSKLSMIANRDPNMEVRVLRKLSKAQAADKKKAKSVADVALFRCRVSLEEIFDFELACDNWTLELDKQNPEYKKTKGERKKLTFTMPRDNRTLPGQKRWLGGGPLSNTVEWNKDEGRFFWANCGKYVFRGTRTHLQNSYFIVSVLSGNPPAFLANSAAVAKAEKMAPIQPHRVIGRCLMNLTSVLDMSVFQGKVKKFTPELVRYIVGDLNGNVKCTLRSKGMKEFEHDFRGMRPEQLKTATTVSHLNKSERYLVVRVKKCESLPVADFDTGSSDPYLRVTWDNMVMLSPTVRQSLRPVFNQSFYYPVRQVFPEMRMGSKFEKKYQESVLKFELESKGSIKIEVWDDDVTSADYLGGTQVTLANILNVRGTSKRNLLGGLKEDKKDDDDDEDEIEVQTEKASQWYEVPRNVRVFDGTRTALQQSNLLNKDAALIHFEAYFYPDWAETLRFEGSTHKDSLDSIWAKKEQQWTATNELRAAEYAIPFPDSIGGKKAKEEGISQTADNLRRFPCIGLHPLIRVETPLMAFVSAIIIPEEWSFPAKLLEWVHCLSFETSTRQTRAGLIPKDGWKDPEYILARRKGAPQDHAILLCSFLLGCKQDAYVVKGTVYSKDERTLDKKENLIEHVWVMTRQKGWVTFWEPCSRQMYHLPQRWNPKKKKRKTTKAAEEVEVQALEDEEQEEEEAAPQWEGEVEDSRVRLEDMESLPTIGRLPKPKMRVAGKKKEEQKGRERLKAELVAQREVLSIAPNREMLREDRLVTWLPYDSIEVVFNGTNTWANRQNHHPACISYDVDEDLEDGQPLKWEPFLKDSDTDLKFSAICPSVSVQPEIKAQIIDELQDDLRTEMMQNLQLYRGKRGMDTMFDHNDELMVQLRIFLDIQETWRQIDPDGPKAEEVLAGYKEIAVDADTSTLSPTQHFYKFIVETMKLRRWNVHGSPFFGDPSYRDYQREQERYWTHLEKLVADFRRKEDNFPIKKGKKFRGFPVHFCTSDQENIRRYLMEVQEYKEMMDMAEEDVYYSIECRILGRLGGVLSVWLYVGIQEPQRDLDFDET